MNIASRIFKLTSVRFSAKTSIGININNYRSYAQLPKRFYKNTGILESNGKYEITLDQRKLKTPKGNLFVVDSEPLALAIANEWNSQKEKIVQTSMHLTTLCNTAIDNPNNLKKYDMVQYIVNHLETDTVLFQSDEDELYKFQVQEWDPVIQWFCDKFAVNIQKSRVMEGPKISKETKQILSRHLLSYTQEAIFGYVYGVDTLKSVILTLACVEKYLTPERAVILSRLEEEFQLGYWGRVEWAHDLNQQDLQSRLSAAVLYIYCNSSSHLMKIKRSLEN
ncbi:atp synthase mitochondrial f1 complex assembly factor 2/atp12 protein mitochondrial precursor [Holotrichia oblita]|uniref:Atp synthase mitochondrial f1 complex assembly factor 2/atp12 protein mitochondrial n=1 Tax=Holotrichia oblita TaxID=644536 RepID=A0ACB9TFF1_HOLOL|nr:atp synthase mitochondrial f1 complex assembly factor 2/atp12 protein mitochondrial precursor [Holotrichia oblita]